MLKRSKITLHVVLAFLAALAVNAKAEDKIPSWILGVPWLHEWGNRSFQFRVDYQTPAEQLIAYVSWAPPDRRCLILTDRVDGLPIMIAVDGRVWLYDVIGGQILLIRAEPELRVGMKGDEFQCQIGMRADFPDFASKTTLDIDLTSIIVRCARKTPEGLLVNSEERIAKFRHKDTEAALMVTGQDTPLPFMFSFETGDDSRFAKLKFDSFGFEKPLPDWHRSVDQVALVKSVPVVAVADAAQMAPEAQDRLHKVQGLLKGRGLFILRPALRDAKLREAIEKNSPIKLDFEAMKANDEKLSDPWRKALRQQGIEVPRSTSTTNPAASTKSTD